MPPSDRVRIGAAPADAPTAPALRQRWLAFAVLLTGNFVTILDLFIVNVAIPNIHDNLPASNADIQLVLVVYAAAYGICLMNGARLGDLYGRRRLFLGGMALFTVASVLCGVAPSPVWLIVARVLQGMGAAILMPQVLASTRLMFEDGMRRRAFGLMGAAQGIAASISQLIGGWLIEHAPHGLGWRMIFLINVPIGLAALVAGRSLLIETRTDTGTRLDVTGAIMGAIGISLLLVPIMLGREHGWPWWSWTLPAGAIPVLAGFIRYEARLAARGGAPMLNPALFYNRPFAAGVSGIFLFYSAASSFFLALTLLLQSGLGLSPLDAGFIFTPSALAFFGASLAGPRLSARLGHYALLLGIAVFGAGLALSAVVAMHAPHATAWLVLSLVLNGAGQGIVIPLALNALLSNVSNEQAGMAAGAVSTLQTVGTSVGVTVVGVVLFTVLAHAGTTPSSGTAFGTALTHGPGIEPAFAYGRALAWATLYNIAASVASLLLFAYALGRRGAG
jgi:MFS family permease